MNSLERVDEHPSPVEFNQNIFSQSTHETLSPLKMHAVHIEDHPIPESGDISMTPSPSPTPNATPFSETSQNELAPLRKTSAMGALHQQTQEDQMQQIPPAIPLKSPLRGAKKKNWLSRLRSKTVGRLSCFRGDSRKKAKSQKAPEQCKQPEPRPKSSSVEGGYANPHIITIPFVGGVGDYGGYSGDCGGGGDSGDCGGGGGGDC